jgi:general secretion pathway protein K
VKLFHAKEEQQRAILLSQATHIWAVIQLQGRKIQQTSPIIASTNGQTFALPKDWRIKATLIDAQSVFNINSIVEQNQKLSYFLLLKQLLPKQDIQEIFFSGVSWLQHNSKSDNFNAFYAQQHPPYQSSEQIMQSLDELRYIKGFTTEIILKLKPYLTALPESTPININTANEEVLGILKPNLKKEDLKKIIYSRGEKGFKSSAALFDILESFKIPPANVTINSQYFWLDYELISPTHQKLSGKCLFYRPLIEKKALPKQVIMVNQFYN